MPPAPDVAALERIAEHLAAIEAHAKDARDYLGGIYGVLQEQEGLSGMLGELGPMLGPLMAQMMGPGAPAGGPHTHQVIEASSA